MGSRRDPALAVPLREWRMADGDGNVALFNGLQQAARRLTSPTTALRRRRSPPDCD